MSVASNNPLLPASRRALPLVARNDLQATPIFFRGTRYWSIKDPISLRYYRLRDDQYHLLNLIDGKRSLDQLQAEQQKQFPHVHWSLNSLQSLVGDFHEKQLLSSRRSGQSEGIQQKRWTARKQKIQGVFLNFLFLRFPGFYPEPVLSRLYPVTRWMFRPAAVILSLCVVCWAMLLLALHFEVFRSQLPEFEQFFGWPNLIYLWLALAVVKVFHEFGHGLSCKHFGGECHSIGVMLLVFSPTLYCDVSDAWMLRNKWQRIMIGAAGMYVEILISALALFVWWYSESGFLHHLALNVFFVTTVTTVIFNANPLMRLDGYYMLCDLIEIPNLSQRSRQLVMQSIGDWCFGIEPQPDPFEPAQGRNWLRIYAVASGIYRWLIVLGIGWFLYTVLKPYHLEMLAVVLSLSSIGGMAGHFIYEVIKMVRVPREQPLSRAKMIISFLGLVTVTALVLFVPIPVFIEAAVLVQPHDVVHVHTQVPGRITQIKVQPGDSIEQGDLLLTFENEELRDREHELTVELAVQQARLKTATALRQPAQIQLATERIQSVIEQLAEMEAQLSRLEIKAPTAGTILAASPLPESVVDSADHSLPSWSGHPLERRVTGAYLESRTHVLSIAPDEKLEAVLFIDQADRNDLSEGQQIRLKFDHLPDMVYSGAISEISLKAIEFVPSSISNKHGGPLPTVTDDQGQERLAGRAWQSTLVLDRDQELFLSGLRGRARIVVAKRSLATIIYRWFRKNLHFRL